MRLPRLEDGFFLDDFAFPLESVAPFAGFEPDAIGGGDLIDGGAVIDESAGPPLQGLCGGAWQCWHNSR